MTDRDPRDLQDAPPESADLPSGMGEDAPADPAPYGAWFVVGVLLCTLVIGLVVLA